MADKLYTVTEVNRLARKTLEKVSLWVEGEVSEVSYKPQYAFVYFKLKDEESVLNCTLSPAEFEKLEFGFKDGVKILAFGTPTIYEPRGKYQLRVVKVKPYGEGELLARIEELKKKLQKEGLFAEERKKLIPKFPEVVGIVTSESGEAWRDIKANLHYPLARLILVDVAVEGASAPAQIIKAIENLNRYGVDLIIVSRGGGSLEALMAFNDEGVARAIARSKIPVVSAVGHEKDVPISDYVSDERVSTPTAVGKLLPDSSHLVAEIHSWRDRMLLTQERKIELLSETLGRFEKDRVFTDPAFTLAQKYQRLDSAYKAISQVRQKFVMLPERLNALRTALSGNVNLLLTGNQSRASSAYDRFLLSSRSFPVSFHESLESYRKQLGHLSPEKVLKRGYSITYLVGKVLRSSRVLRGGEDVNVKLAEGGFHGKVVKPDE